jgi:hypothetical protein
MFQAASSSVLWSSDRHLAKTAFSALSGEQSLRSGRHGGAASEILGGGYSNLGTLGLTWGVKIGYNRTMFRSLLSLFLRFGLIAAIWALTWRLVEPRTQLMRILRAALLLCALLCVLAVLKMTGQ